LHRRKKYLHWAATFVDSYDWPWIFYVNVPVGIPGRHFHSAIYPDPRAHQNAIPRRFA
jgi:hypothetical protein